MSTPSTPSMPPAALAARAVRLSADIYLPLAGLRAKYPAAIIREAGCDRVMIVKQESAESAEIPPSAFPLSAFSASSCLKNSPLWVVFMGTHDRASLISDLDVKRHAIGDGREVHSGFDNGVEELFPDILSAISQVGTPGPGVRLVWTGHSRGASQAILAADRWETYCSGGVSPPLNGDGHRPPLQTAGVFAFAPARPGNAAFRDRYNFRLGHKTFFYHHGADIVPWLPGWLLGNRHVGHRLWFPDFSVLGGTGDPPVPFGDPPVGRRQVAAGDGRVARPTQPILDPPLPPLALNLLRVLWRRQARGLESLLADHHVSTYVQLLT